MPSIEVQHTSLLLPGYWRILSFGKLSENPCSASPDLRIRVSLAPLRDPTEAPPQEGLLADAAFKQMLLPIGELPRLHLNAILHDGRLSTHGRDQLRFERHVQRRLNCTRSNVRVIDRFEVDAQGSLIIPKRSKWTAQIDDPELQGLFVAIGSQSDPYATVIPAVEVFRFFYATSDVLAKALLRDQFLDPDTHLWSLDKSALTDDGQALIWLRKRMLDADARFLARFAFDNYALQQAQQIFLFASAAGMRQGERLIRALPPFEDVVNADLCCLPIGGPDGERVLVTRMFRCDWAPPWKMLKWDRDNDGRYDPDKREEREVTDWSPNLQLAEDQVTHGPKELADASPSAPSVPSRLRETEIADRFPVLARTPAEKMPQEGAKTRADGKSWRVLLNETCPGSVVEGRSSGQLVIRTIIEGLIDKPTPKKEITNDVNAAIGEIDYLSVPRYLQAIKRLGIAQVEYLTVLNSITFAHGLEFNVYPRELDGKEKGWLYVDKDKYHRRMVLLAKVDYLGCTRYVIELQPRRPNECSTLVAWRSAGGELPGGILECLLMDCAKAEAATLNSADMFGVHWARLRHLASKEDDDSAKHFLQRAFSVKPHSPIKKAEGGERN